MNPRLQRQPLPYFMLSAFEGIVVAIVESGAAMAPGEMHNNAALAPTKIRPQARCAIPMFT
jgi:hypothetical protein